MSVNSGRVEFEIRPINGGKVATYIQALQEKASAAHGVTVSELLDELEEIRLKALEAEPPQRSAAAAATMAMAKLAGLDKCAVELTGAFRVETKSIKDILTTKAADQRKG